MSMKAKQILITGINKAELLETEVYEPKENEVMVKTAVSTLSCGTERAHVTGETSISIYSDPNDKEVRFPRASGYSSSGTVIKTGENVKDLKVGDRVAMSWSSHKQINVLERERVVRIDDSVTFSEAAFCYIGTFPLAALRKTRIEIGESLLVMGAGILGILSVRFAKAAGAAPVIVADPIKERREKALSSGADYAFDPFDAAFAENVKAAADGGVKCAIEVTGIGAGLNECLDCMAKFGRVALLGCTRDPNFTVDYYRKVHGPGIQLIGAHDMARPVHESFPGYFTTEDDMKSILRLCRYGRIDLKNMVDEIYSPEECPDVYYRLATDRNFPTVVQFDWTRIG